MIHIRAADTAGNHAPYASIKSSGTQLLGQIWTDYGSSCYSGSRTFSPSSGHTTHFYDPESDTMTYTVHSDDMIGGAINSSNYAVLTFRHPPASQRTHAYTATDPDNLYDSVSLWVKKNGCTDTMSVTENSPKDTVVGSLGGSNSSDGSSFTISNGASGDVATYFDIDSSTGQITVKDGTSLDYETKDRYTGTFSYTVANATASGAIRINVGNIAAPKVDAPALAPNAANPGKALDVSWTAPTTTLTITDYDVQYRARGASQWTDANFSGTGTSTTITGLTAGTEYEVQVRSEIAVEGDGPWSESSVVLYIAENSKAGDNIGASFDFTAVDYNPHSYSSSGADKDKISFIVTQNWIGGNNSGVISSSSVQLKVKTGNIPDYESDSEYVVGFRVVERNGANQTLLHETYKIFIFVTDVDEPPGKPTVTVANNTTTPTTKLDVSWTAPTMTGKPAIDDYDVQYRKTYDSTWTSHSFTGTGTTTTLTGLEAGKSYDVQVRANNAETDNSDTPTDNDSPWSNIANGITEADGVTRSIAENSAAGTSIGAAVTATANTNYTYTHSLGGTDASDFDIVASSGQIQVKSALDYETKTSYSVEVIVAVHAVSITSLDPNAPGDYTVPVTINVTDVNEAPTFTADTATRSVAENATAGTNVGAAVTATDVDAGASLTYSLEGTDGSKFDIGSSAGQITVKTGNVPNYEAKTSYSVTVKVSDGSLTDTVAVTINVTDVTGAAGRADGYGVRQLHDAHQQD